MPKPYGKFWFESSIDFYQQIHTGRHQHHDRFIRWLADNFSGHSVCEIGCGYGVFYPEFFTSKGMFYTGIDLAPNAIAYCQSHKPGLFICADVLRQPLLGKYDLVFSHATIDNVPSMNSFLLAHYNLTNDALYCTSYRGFFRDLQQHNYSFNETQQVYYNDLSPRDAFNTLMDAGARSICITEFMNEAIITAWR